MTPQCRGPMASSSGSPSRRSPAPSNPPFTPRGPTESYACSNTWTMKMWVDIFWVSVKDLYFLCVQIIGLLDVFTPQCSLDEFTDVYMVTHLMGADLNNIIRTQRWELIIGRIYLQYNSVFYRLSDDHVQFLVYQIVRGMKYVHSAGIIHRWERLWLL